MSVTPDQVNEIITRLRNGQMSDVEHPAIVAKLAAYDKACERGASITELRTAAQDYLAEAQAVAGPAKFPGGFSNTAAALDRAVEQIGPVIGGYEQIEDVDGIRQASALDGQAADHDAEAGLRSDAQDHSLGM